MTKQYINEREFNDFKDNFKLLVNTLNHNITDIKKDVHEFKNKSLEVFGEVKELKGQIKMSNQLLWVIVGIFATLFGASLLSLI